MSLNPTSTTQLDLPVAESFSVGHCCDVITTIAVPILLAIALSLTIYYAIHPVNPLIPIYGDFSLSLPLLICGGTGIVLTLILVIQIVRRKKITEACGQCLGHQVRSIPSIQQKVRSIVHPGGRPAGQTIEQYKIDNEAYIQEAKRLIGDEVTFPTRDGIQLGGYWHRSKYRNAPTVIFFHGNQMRAEDAYAWSDLYKKWSFNVLSVEFRGYGISEGIAAGPDAEMEAYYDAEAALHFVYSQGVATSKILAHGHSIGGAYAAALGSFFHVPYIILENTFLDLTHVATHASKVVPDALITPSIVHAYQKGSAPPLPRFPTGLPLQTDNFNNLKKVEQISGEILIIHGMNDHLICADTGRKLVSARYKEKKAQEDHLINHADGHNMYALFADHNAQYREPFLQFLLAIK